LHSVRRNLSAWGVRTGFAQGERSTYTHANPRKKFQILGNAKPQVPGPASSRGARLGYWLGTRHHIGQIPGSTELADEEHMGR